MTLDYIVSALKIKLIANLVRAHTRTAETNTGLSNHVLWAKSNLQAVSLGPMHFTGLQRKGGGGKRERKGGRGGRGR